MLATVRAPRGHNVHDIRKVFFAPLVESPLDAVVEGGVSTLPTNTEIFTNVSAEGLIVEQFVSREEEALARRPQHAVYHEDDQGQANTTMTS